MSNCIEGTLAPYIPNTDAPWNKTRVHHLYNRLGNGANLTELNNGLLQTPSDLVDAMFAEAHNAPLPNTTFFPWVEHPTLDWISNQPYSVFDRRARKDQLTRHFGAGQVLHPVKFKLALFWSNHFVTENNSDEIAVISSVYLYYRLIHQYALGNYKEFVEKVGLTPRMLFYLNGRENIASNPNENYARELLELFTLGIEDKMGENNYTQGDIENIARGLTGWYAGEREPDYPDNIILQPDEYRIRDKDHHDWTSIMLFGQTFEFDAEQVPTDNDDQDQIIDSAYAEYEWIINTIFEQKEQVLAEFICRKLYKFYVYEIPDEEIVTAMANILRDTENIGGKWEIEPVLKALFKSKHFFNENAFGIQIKGPVEMHTSYIRKTGYVYNVHWYSEKWADQPNYVPSQPYTPYINEVSVNALPYTTYNHSIWWADTAAHIGQRLLNPPNVAGWPGGRNWINESLIVDRWEKMTHLITHYFDNGAIPADLINGVALHQHVIDFMKALTDDSPDINVVVREVIKHFFISPLEEDLIIEAISVFKPWNYDEDTWNLDWPNTWDYYRRLMIYLTRVPEFQLV